MSRRFVRLLLDDMLEAIERIDRYVAGIDQPAFLADDKTADAVVRNLEVLGEAAAHVPEDFGASTSDVDWPQIVGLRNRMVHG